MVAARPLRTLCEKVGRSLPPSGGGEGALVPQLSLPPAPGLLSSSWRQAHTPSEAGRVAARHKRGPRSGERERPSVPFHPVRPASPFTVAAIRSYARRIGSNSAAANNGLEHQHALGRARPAPDDSPRGEVA